MTLTIPDEIARSAEEQARASGTTAETLLIRALHAHFPPVPAELRAEVDAWERASDEDMARLLEGCGPSGLRPFRLRGEG